MYEDYLTISDPNIFQTEHIFFFETCFWLDQPHGNLFPNGSFEDMKYVSKLRGLVSEEAGFGGFAEREMVRKPDILSHVFLKEVSQ